MKIIIVGDPKRREMDEPLIEEAKSKFDEVVYAPISNIRFDITKSKISGGTSANFEGRDLSEFDYILPIPTPRHSELFYTLLWVMSESRMPFNADCYMTFMNNGLLRNFLMSKGVRMRPFVSVASNVPVGSIKSGLRFPVIVRPPNKRVAVSNAKTLEDVISLYKFGTPILIEKPLKSDMDTWVFVSGNEAVASYKKYQRNGNVIQPSLKGTDLSGIAVKTKNAIGCDYCAIRFLLRKNDWVVDRVTLSPDFAEFQEMTGVNIARHVISGIGENRKPKEKSFMERVEEYLRANFPQIMKGD